MAGTTRSSVADWRRTLLWRLRCPETVGHPLVLALRSNRESSPQPQEQLFAYAKIRRRKWKGKSFLARRCMDRFSVTRVTRVPLCFQSRTSVSQITETSSLRRDHPLRKFSTQSFGETDSAALKTLGKRGTHSPKLVYARIF